MSVDDFNWQRMKYIQKLHRVLYAIGLGPLIGKIILLLTTTGRKSGLKRVTPLQYEEIDGKYYLGSARGLNADWVRNIQANSQVNIRVKSDSYQGQAEIVTDPARFADFIEIRLERHPVMVGLMMEKVHGLSKEPSREELKKMAEKESLVIITLL
ncbi:MAG: nitroreductase family deazaflavin-dependent oxidoreductase [Anaerolineae bacterium]|jgi:deazaflavin-dependent oxidoreductase (nitroreductase family)|nr:nitroreductase family deazaflavin-dependent oxidoreductase [Anaerolineae bacterium]MBT3712271.1 nitroreductase family deazaflavin-dependent oxidoreductase [Anaerolineae bacterium]MBT4310771.1 nitroreductase family deazaflavin-dependent oxidoreductase [Anaerolineae bacterium]MBT4458231.1 nitroreductase family deazaflavin-dependent oxidoreductase [Anaerolineae bacterium]MBT4841014.1 nitroreductase family deazaflavin-dependent oxidoreductase [Anaerolineae bacterium]